MRYFLASITFFIFQLLQTQYCFAAPALPEQPLTSDNFQLSISSQSRPLTINQIQRWVLHLEDTAGNIVSNAKIDVKGGMPDHNHGLPTAPKITEYLGDGNYLLEGIKFHMAGYWRIEFVINANNHQDVLVLDLQM